MGQISLLFDLTIVSLFAAIAQTAGFVGMFAFEVLNPYKWQLLIGGTAVILASEVLAYLLTKRMAATGNEVDDAC